MSRAAPPHVCLPLTWGQRAATADAARRGPNEPCAPRSPQRGRRGGGAQGRCHRAEPRPAHGPHGAAAACGRAQLRMAAQCTAAAAPPPVCTARLDANGRSGRPRRQRGRSDAHGGNGAERRACRRAPPGEPGRRKSGRGGRSPAPTEGQDRGTRRQRRAISSGAGPVPAPTTEGIQETAAARPPPAKAQTRALPRRGARRGRRIAGSPSAALPPTRRTTSAEGGAEA